MTVIHTEFHLGDKVEFEHDEKTLTGIIVRLWSSERTPSDDDLIELEDGCYEVVDIGHVDGYPDRVFITNTCNIRLLDKGK